MTKQQWFCYSQNKMKNQITTREVLTNADTLGLNYKEITTGMNGYPQGLGNYAVIGFDSFADAEKFADENGCEVHLFKVRDGHQLWSNCGRKYEPLKASEYISDLGDDYSEVDNSTDYIQDRLKELANDFDGDFDTLKKFIADQEEILEEVENAEKDEVVIVNCGKYSETIKAELMSYHEDVTTLSIGVFVEGGIEESEDEE